MIVIQEGNLLDAKECILCHQVNCQNRMGSGVAKALTTRWPEVKKNYHAFCDGKQPTQLHGCVQVIRVSDNKFVANIFGQLSFGYDGKLYTDYQALDQAFGTLASMTSSSLAFPYGFGCGLGGGDWNKVYALIEKHFSDRAVTIYKLPEG